MAQRRRLCGMQRQSMAQRHCHNELLGDAV